LLVCDWLHSVGQNHFYVMILLNRLSIIFSLLIQSHTSRRFCTDSKSDKSNPLHPSGHSIVKASSVRTTRTFRPDLPLCREASNCSSNTAGRHSVFDKSKDFFPKNRYGKTVATVWTMYVPVRTLSLIRQVVHTNFNRLNVSLYGLDAQALIWK